MRRSWSLLWIAVAGTTPGLALAKAIEARSETAADKQVLLLDVSINGVATNRIGEFVLQGGILRARRAEWVDLGIAPPAIQGSTPDDLLGLAEFPALTWIFDASQQTLAISAPLSWLVPTLLDAPSVARNDTLQSGKGATLNYDINVTAVGAARIASGLFEARVFSPIGVISSGFLATAVTGADTERRRSAIRLYSSFSYSDRGALRRYQIGDFITGGLSWTRPVRMGGVQVTADYSTRPDLITFPLPSLRGSAAVPSTVDVLENGSRLFSRAVGAGPFEVPQLPIVTGAGTIAMTVRDALGRQVTITQPFYASATLLSPGFQTFSLQAGAVRQNWGVRSNDYAGIAASGTWRRGLTPSTTIEAGAEATRDGVMTGAGLIFNLNQLAILNVAAAASAGGGSGGQFTAGIQRVGTVFSLSASATVATKRFRDIAAVNGDPVERLQVNGSAGLTFGRLGSAGIAFVAVNRDPFIDPVEPCILAPTDLPGGCAGYGPRAERTRILSASYSVQLGRVALYATAYGDVKDRRSRGAVVGLTIPIGKRSSASLSGGGGGGSRYAQVDVSQSASTVGDWGYRAYASVGGTPHQFAQVQYKAPWALLSAGADHVGGQTAVRGEMQGSLSVIAGGIFAANAIDDSFAIVDTDGLPNIRVLQENRMVGQTNARGLLLVPDLRAFDINRIAIEATDVPPDIMIDTAAREIQPQDRSGVVVKFRTRASRGAMLILVDEAGLIIPVGSTATLRATGTIGPVGYDGNSYVTGLQLRNQLDVVRPDGSSCSLSFDYHPKAGDLPTIGPLKCVEAP